MMTFHGKEDCLRRRLINFQTSDTKERLKKGNIVRKLKLELGFREHNRRHRQTELVMTRDSLLESRSRWCRAACSVVD
jgi:hypothetical protein